MENTAQHYDGYIGFIYRNKIKENLKAGLSVERAIQLAQESMGSIPHLQIEDNPLQGDYFNSQKGGLK